MKEIAILVDHHTIREAAGENYKETWWGNSAIAKETVTRIINYAGAHFGSIYFSTDHYLINLFNGPQFSCGSLSYLPILVLKAMDGHSDSLLVALNTQTGFPMFEVYKPLSGLYK